MNSRRCNLRYQGVGLFSPGRAEPFLRLLTVGLHPRLFVFASFQDAVAIANLPPKGSGKTKIPVPQSGTGIVKHTN